MGAARWEGRPSHPSQLLAACRGLRPRSRPAAQHGNVQPAGDVVRGSPLLTHGYRRVHLPPLLVGEHSLSDLDPVHLGAPALRLNLKAVHPPVEKSSRHLTEGCLWPPKPSRWTLCIKLWRGSDDDTHLPILSICAISDSSAAATCGSSSTRLSMNPFCFERSICIPISARSEKFVFLQPATQVLSVLAGRRLISVGMQQATPARTVAASQPAACSPKRASRGGSG